MKNNIPKRILKVMEVLENDGYEAYVVGGCVRDFLLNKEPKDFDICTNATVSEILEVFKDFHVINDNGLKHNTVSLHYDNDIIEITSYRSLDNTLTSDLLKRDLTINAIAYNKDFVDPLNGKEDIENKIIKVCSPTSFQDDYLRILRALRFSSQLGFKIDEETMKLIKEQYQGLKDVAMERINKELCLILEGQYVKDILLEYKEVFAFIIPELEKIIDFNQFNKYHQHDVFTHSAFVVSNSKQNYITRVAALLHDIGKPNCFTKDEEGHGHFYGHPYESYLISKKILKRLKFSIKDCHEILYLIENHDNHVSSKKGVKRLLAKAPDCSKETFLKLLDLQLADRLDHINCENDFPHDLLVSYLNEIIEEQNCLTVKDLKLNGHDFMELGIFNHKIKETQLILLELVMEDKLENDKETLINYIKENILVE